MTDDDWTRRPCWDVIRVRDDVWLRPLRHGDADAILAILAADPSIRDRVGVVARAHTVEDIGRIVDGAGFGPAAVRHAIVRGAAAADGEVVGYVNLWRAGDFFGDLADPDDHGFGYFLSPAARGQRLVPDVLRALMDVASRELRVHSFIAFCEDDNPASSRTLVSAGLQRTDVVWSSPDGWVERRHDLPVAP